MHYPLHLKSIILPNGPFSLFMPKPDQVAFIFRQLQKENKAEPFPYWARLWPSAIGLASFIQQHPGFVAGKQVAELAAGIGLPSLVAATYAKSVWCTDIVEEAMEVAANSANFHYLKNIQFEACNWNRLPINFDAEILLLSDVNYDPTAFLELERVLIALLQTNCTIILATPQRLMAKPFLEKLSPFFTDNQEECIENHGQKTLISIFVLKQSNS
jgi:predicted nicotinamide N-methyase